MPDKKSLNEEIFEIFFEKLEKDAEFPKTIINSLKELLSKEQAISKSKLSKIIRKDKNGSKD